MPAYHIERSILIDAGEAKVRPAIEDFGEWPKWSPWLCMEPDTKLNVYGTPGQTDHSYDWDGELVGAGKMKIASLEQGKIKMDLSFLRPFKSEAKVMMEINPVGDSQTEVTWHMDGKMPFFLFFMIGMMKAMIGMDYARGLKMLKEYVETGTVKSKTEIVGVVDVSQIHYLGVEAFCTMDDVGESMGQTLPAAHKAATNNQIEMNGPPGAMYHNVDLKKQTMHYTAIVQTKTPSKVDDAKTGTITPCKALKITHKGSYHHLGNAWSTAMSYQRNKKLKMLKSHCGFELYTNDPAETPEEDLITEIFIPVRA